MINVTVSIVLSVFNGEKFIGKCIESVLSQTFSDFEFIIINDGSNDHTLRILKEYKKMDGRITLYTNCKRLGLTKSLNLGLKMSKGVYIARIDADDVWYPTKLKEQLKFLEANKEYGLIGTAYNEIDEKGSILYSRQRLPLLATDDGIRANIVRFNPFFHSSVMFRREILYSIGFYNENFRYAQDYEYWIRIMAKYRVANLPEILASRRYTKDMISIKKEKEQRKYAIKAKLLAIKLLNKPVTEYRYLVNDILVCYLPRDLVRLIRRIK